MAESSNNITLRINANNYTGWSAVRVTRSIERLAHTFNLTLSERWNNSSRSRIDEPPQIKAGDSCELLCGDELVITGAVDDALPSYDAQKHNINITGRSLAADFIDCGLLGRQFKNQNLLQLAVEVVKPYGLSVRAETDVGAPFALASIEPGQTGFEFLEKHARLRGVRLISDASGAIIISRAGNVLVPDTLELGVNILSASGRFSIRDRYYETIVVGQTAGSDSWNGTAAAANQATAIDKDVRVTRKHVIVAEQSADTAACQRRAQWQRNTAYGKSQMLTYTVKGWTHSLGLWKPNTRVPVRDKWMRLNGERLLISAVQLILDEQGARTELQVMPPEAFDLIDLPAKKSVTKWN